MKIQATYDTSICVHLSNIVPFQVPFCLKFIWNSHGVKNLTYSFMFNIFQEASGEMEEKCPTLEEKLEKYETENEKLKNEKQTLLSR